MNTREKYLHILKREEFEKKQLEEAEKCREIARGYGFSC